MQLDLNQLRELLATLDQTNISELTLKSADFELTVRKGVSISHSLPLEPVLAGTAASAGLVTMPPIPMAPDPGAREAVASSPAMPPSTTPPPDSKWVEIISPMVGTFYRAPAPGEAPFVEGGDRIRPGQTVCIIEAMKLMNEIEAEIGGQVMEILVQNGDPVEFNQPLMRINPD